MRKNKSKRRRRKLKFDEDGIPIHDSDLEFSESDYEESEKTTKFGNPFNKLREWSKPKKSDIPISFNVGLTILLLFIYISVVVVSFSSYPMLSLVLLPSIYVFLVFIKHERERSNERYWRE